MFYSERMEAYKEAEDLINEARMIIVGVNESLDEQWKNRRMTPSLYNEYWDNKERINELGDLGVISIQSAEDEE